MDSRIALSVEQYAVSTSLFDMALAGLSEEELLKSVGDGSNPMIWMVGHLASTRINLLNALGRKHEVPWGNLFDRGETIDNPGEYPPLDQILAVWKETTAALMARLEEIGDEELTCPQERVHSLS